jgi:3-oxoacyl-[acyl-carrier-protein] synthase II
MNNSSQVARGMMSITSSGLVSPVGYDVAALECSRVVTHQAPTHLGTESLPPRPMWAASDLPVERFLGRKGVSHLDRTTKLGLIAAHLAFADFAEDSSETFRRRTGVVMGTSTGSIRNTSEFSRETLVQDRPYLVNPRLFPSSVMNCCAGQIAIRNSLRGVNATVAGGQLSMIHALRYAMNAIRCGHVDRLLVGAVEELSAQSAWAWHRTRGLADEAAVGEGCGVFMVERTVDIAEANRPPLISILSCEVGTYDPLTNRDELASGVGECIRRALIQAGVAANEITTVAIGATHQRALSDVELDGIRRGLGGIPPTVVEIKRTVGECFSANGAMQIAALLGGVAPVGPSSDLCLVTSVGYDGTAGCLVLQRFGPPLHDSKG